MKIEVVWPSHFHSDGRPKRPDPSGMHGWLAKMRGTLLGNEDLRSKGMREMKHARARKEQLNERRRHVKEARRRKEGKGPSLFTRLFGGAKKRGQPKRRPTGASTRSRPSSSRRPSRQSSTRQPLSRSQTQRSQRPAAPRHQSSQRSRRR